MSTISERLEALPYSRSHKRLLAMGGLGYAFDALDGAIMAFVLPALTKLWSLGSVHMGVLASSTYIGYLFGSLLAGVAGDIIGRRKIMMSALAIYSIASLASAFCMSWEPFFWLRVVAGFGIGAESSIIAPFLAEFVAAQYRGRFLGALAGFFSFGYVAAALLGYLIVPSTPEGWRIVLVITALPVAMLLWWRRALPESPRWLELRGRHREADEVVSRFEREIHRSTPAEPHTAMETRAASPAQASEAGASNSVLSGALRNLMTLWSPRLARITLMTWIMWAAFIFAYYGFFTWIPSLLVKSGLTVTRSYGYSLIIYGAQIPGYFSGAYLNDRIGRKATISLASLMAAASALALAFSSTDLAVTASGFLLSFFMNMGAAALYAYTPEVFPTHVRATGMGTASAIGRLGAIGAPIYIGYVYPLWGFVGVFGTTTALLLISAMVVLLLGPKSHGKPLDQIS